MSKFRGSGTSLGRCLHVNFSFEAASGLGTGDTQRQAQAARNC